MPEIFFGKAAMIVISDNRNRINQYQNTSFCLY